jgi:proprotein convertase subtilisin/kexin type 5
VNNTCDSCPQNCTNCQGNSSLVICTVCNNGYVIDGTRCYLTCVTAGTFAVNGICQGCSSACLTCSITHTNCTSCFPNSTTPYLQNNNCISVCPSGFYADNSTYSCVKCTSPCEFCLNSSVRSCQTCITGHFLFDTECLATCPTNYYNSSGLCLRCVSPCFTCIT